MTRASTRIKNIVSSLRADAIREKPLQICWEDAFDRYWDTDELQCVEVICCDNCGHMNVVEFGEAECSKCGHEALTAEGPMMNYFYPLPKYIGTAHKLAEEIGAVCLCAVDHPELGMGLALTGGGMDLSWEICAGYVAAGYLPPTHFSNLPVFAQELDEENKLVLFAMKESLEVEANWCKNRLGNFRDTQKAIYGRHQKAVERKRLKAG